MTASSLRLDELLQRLAGRSVWVVGDLMLDEYLIGSVERISPEGPVPVLRVEDREVRPGGAANVARQIAALGARVHLAGIVGSDEPGEALLALCSEHGVDTQAVARLHGRRTTRKTRALSKGHQLLRVDSEESTRIEPAHTHELLERLQRAPRPDVVVVSDYAKGVVSDGLTTSLREISEARWILVDPKRDDLRTYRGADVLTPNLAELQRAAGEPLDAKNLPAMAAATRRLMTRHAFETFVVTLGEHGLLVVPSRDELRHFPAARRTVFDVTGAGDTVIGVLASGLAGGVPVAEAARLANIAAGIAVGEVGAVAVTPERLRETLQSTEENKILDRASLANRAASWRATGKRVVFTNGCFDLLHAGHLALLRAAADQGDVLVLAINSDDSVRRLKGPDRPLFPAAQRAAMLAALECVDAVTIFPEDSPLETLAAVRPHVLVKGADYRLDQVIGRELVERGGGRVILVPLEGSWSTSGVVHRIQSTARKADCASSAQ